MRLGGRYITDPDTGKTVRAEGPAATGATVAPDKTPARGKPRKASARDKAGQMAARSGRQDDNQTETRTNE